MRLISITSFLGVLEPSVKSIFFFLFFSRRLGAIQLDCLPFKEPACLPFKEHGVPVCSSCVLSFLLLSRALSLLATVYCSAAKCRLL